MKNPTTATIVQQQRPAVSILPADHFTPAAGTKLSIAEQKLVENFRQLDHGGRATMASVMHRAALRERNQRIVSNTACLRLVGGAK